MYSNRNAVGANSSFQTNERKLSQGKMLQIGKARILNPQDFQMRNPEELNIFAKEFITERLERSTVRMREELKKNAAKIRKEYLNACEGLFQRCLKQQEKGEKAAIRFMYFFYLKSALLTGKHEIQINAYSNEGYMDSVETMKLWYPSFIMDIYEKDMQELDAAAKKKILHYGYPQYMELRERCFPIYISFVGKYLMTEIGNVTALEAFQKIQKEEDFEIIFGGYMDRGIRLFPPMKIHVDDNKGEVQ